MTLFHLPRISLIVGQYQHGRAFSRDVEGNNWPLILSSQIIYCDNYEVDWSLSGSVDALPEQCLCEVKRVAKIINNHPSTSLISFLTNSRFPVSTTWPTVAATSEYHLHLITINFCLHSMQLIRNPIFIHPDKLPGFPFY